MPENIGEFWNDLDRRTTTSPLTPFVRHGVGRERANQPPEVHNKETQRSQPWFSSIIECVFLYPVSFRAWPHLLRWGIIPSTVVVILVVIILGISIHIAQMECFRSEYPSIPARHLQSFAIKAHTCVCIYPRINWYTRSLGRPVPIRPVPDDSLSPYL